jgi:hypothetical protein
MNTEEGICTDMLRVGSRPADGGSLTRLNV